MRRKDEGGVGEEATSPTPEAPDQLDAFLAAVEDADTLAGTDTRNFIQHRTNPRILRHQVESQDALHTELIDLEDERARVSARREHGRELAAAKEEASWRDADADRTRRAITEAQEDADEAAADLAMIRGFDREESPVTSSRRLSRLAKGWRVADVGYSLVGSGLSAVGITATLTVATSLPLLVAAGVGVAAETVLTVRTVDLLGRLSRLDSHDKTPRETMSDRDSQAGRPVERDDEQGSRTHLVIQIGVLLAVSVALNVIGLVMGAGFLAGLGVAGALLAAMAGLGSHAASRAATDVVRRNLKTWRGGDWDTRREELRARAAGAYIPQRTEDPVVEGIEETDTAVVAAPVDVERIATETAQQVADRMYEYLTGGSTAAEKDSEALELSDADRAFLAGLDTQMSALEGDGQGGGVAEVDPTPSPAGSDQHGHPDDNGPSLDSPAGGDQPKHLPEASKASAASPAGADQGGRRSAAVARAERERRREERRDRVAELWGEGLSVREIAEQMTRDRRTITTDLRARGVTPEAIRAREGR